MTIEPSFASELPLLSKVVEYSNKLDVTLDGWHCLYVQHLLMSNVSCVNFLLSLGLSKSKLFVIGKAYSTSNLALDAYSDLGVEVRNEGVGYRYNEPFDAALVRKAKSKIEDFLATGAKKLLLVDEGGILSRALSEIPTEEGMEIVVVELTSRGQQYYEDISERSTLIDVARSFGKKIVEAPLISESMFQFICCSLKDISIGVNPTVAVIGVGAIGSAMCNLMGMAGFTVVSYDVDGSRGTETFLTDALANSRIVVSSTGTGLDFDKLLSCSGSSQILFNCGSSDVEFNLWKYFSDFNFRWSYGCNSKFSENPLHRDLIIERGVDALTVFHGGFPINFDGSADPIPPRKIQITRSLLMAGVVQGLVIKDLGLHPLWSHIQNELCDDYFALNGISHAAVG